MFNLLDSICQFIDEACRQNNWNPSWDKVAPLSSSLSSS